MSNKYLEKIAGFNFLSGFRNELMSHGGKNIFEGIKNTASAATGSRVNKVNDLISKRQSAGATQSAMSDHFKNLGAERTRASFPEGEAGSKAFQDHYTARDFLNSKAEEYAARASRINDPRKMQNLNRLKTNAELKMHQARGTLAKGAVGVGAVGAAGYGLSKALTGNNDNYQQNYAGYM